MKVRVIKVIICLMLMLTIYSGCSKQQASELSTGNVNIKFAINRETAVAATGGGYKVYVGRYLNFSTKDAVKQFTVAGNSAVNGFISIDLSITEKGTYYAKAQAFSTLVDPYTSQAAISDLSDEVQFEVK